VHAVSSGASPRHEEAPQLRESETPRADESVDDFLEMLAGEDRGEIHDRPDQCRAGDASDACDVGGGKVARPVHEGIDSTVVTALEVSSIASDRNPSIRCSAAAARCDATAPGPACHNAASSDW